MSERKFKKIKYEDPVEFSIERALEKIEFLLEGDYVISKRAAGLLLLQEDKDIEGMVREKDKDKFGAVKEIVKEAKGHYASPLDYIIAMRRQKEASDIIKEVLGSAEKKKISFRERLSRITMNPVTGIPILFMILYWGIYKFVGEFGAGTVVDFLETTVFEGYVNPFITDIFNRIIPWGILRDLFVGEYGVITLGVRYAVALILPIVTFFFIIFSIIEDTGYLPRLAMLIDRVFKKIGLSGRAVIPMVLGFGCDTMATMVTRTLPTKRERVISTMLLALAIPCSAQLGVIIALLEGRRLAFFIWAGVIALVFLFIGYLTALLLPGQRPTFYMEVPPLRFPKISNVLVKTYTRVKWYFKEVLPLFVFASVFIWLGQITKTFDLAVDLLKKPVNLIGLPPEAAEMFLFGFFRRDYGAAGLYDLNKQGLLTGVQLVVASVALTLFLPCIAQFLMNVKERGIKTGVGISFFILFFSFAVAFVVNYILVNIGITL
jgi:ferrous iron transport protein B